MGIEVIGIVILVVLGCFIVTVVGVPLAMAANFVLGLLRHPVGGSLERRSNHPARPPVPPKVRTAVLNRDGWACVICGASGDDALARGGLQLDHIIPYSRGGATTYENLQTMCKVCNDRKGAR